MKFIFTLTICLLAYTSVSYSAPIHGYSPEEKLLIQKHNQDLRAAEQSQEGLLEREYFSLKNGETVLPFGEHKDQGYLLFNDETDFASYDAKRGFLENLPDSVTPVIFTQHVSPEYIQSIKEKWGPFLKEPSRLKIMATRSRGNSFWARDGVPVPVFKVSEKGQQFALVDARYYHRFEADRQFAIQFNADLLSHNYYFEGGNLMANSVGDCIIVDNEEAVDIPSYVFDSHYGCKNLIRLPFLRGIGHVDESIKFVDDQIVMTDIDEYEEILEAEGFAVVRIPKAKGYETYLNSVILEDTVYVPVFGRPADKDALDVYRSLGFKVVPLNSSVLSNRGLGSLHCISMVYPKVEFRDLAQKLNAIEI